MIKFGKLATFASFSLLAVSACTIGGDNTVGPDAAIIDVDAAPQPDASTECTAAAEYLDVGTLPEEASIAQFQSGVTIFQGALNEDQDQVAIELYNDVGVFAGMSGFPAGTYTLDATETQYRTCGLCVRIFGDVQGNVDPDRGHYFATGGTVTITEVGEVGGRFKVTLDDVTFTHVTISGDFTSTPVGDGCESHITNLTTDVEITAGLR
jgi:hypothetical protein